MGIRSIAKPAAPEPKARCPRCNRPVAVLGRGACVYCGAVVEVAGASAATPTAPAVPPELLIAFDPTLQPPRSAGERWLVRIVALGLAGVVIGVVAMFTLAK